MDKLEKILLDCLTIKDKLYLSLSYKSVCSWGIWSFDCLIFINRGFICDKLKDDIYLDLKFFSCDRLFVFFIFGNIYLEKIIDVELDFDNSLLLFSLLYKGLYLDVNDFILEFFDIEEISFAPSFVIIILIFIIIILFPLKKIL